MNEISIQYKNRRWLIINITYTFATIASIFFLFIKQER